MSGKLDLTYCIEQLEQEFDIFTDDSPWANLWRRVKSAAMLESVHDDIKALVDADWEMQIGIDADGDYAINIQEQDAAVNEMVYGTNFMYIHHAETLKELLEAASKSLIK